MKLLDFYTKIYRPDNISPDDPITLFTIYYSPEIIKYIIQITNLNSRISKNPDILYTRVIK
jgi:hypothetical protein